MTGHLINGRLMDMDQTDPARPYMYHCLLLFHEDMGMMGQYVVGSWALPARRR